MTNLPTSNPDRELDVILNHGPYYSLRARHNTNLRIVRRINCLIPAMAASPETDFSAAISELAEELSPHHVGEFWDWIEKYHENEGGAAEIKMINEYYFVELQGVADDVTADNIVLALAMQRTAAAGLDGFVAQQQAVARLRDQEFDRRRIALNAA